MWPGSGRVSGVMISSWAQRTGLWLTRSDSTESHAQLGERASRDLNDSGRRGDGVKGASLRPELGVQVAQVCLDGVTDMRTGRRPVRRP